MKALLGMLIVACLAGCSGDGEPRTLEIAQALEEEDRVVRVTGYLYTDDAPPPNTDRGFTLRLCSALAESFPPQCGRPSLVVESAVFEAADLEREGDVGWSARPVVLTGRVHGETLRIVDTEG